MSACQVTVEIILHTGQVTVEIILQPETQSEATTPVRKAISLLARLDPGQAARPPSVQVIQTMSLSASVWYLHREAHVQMIYTMVFGSGHTCLRSPR